MIAQLQKSVQSHAVAQLPFERAVFIPPAFGYRPFPAADVHTAASKAVAFASSKPPQANPPSAPSQAPAPQLMLL